MRIAAHALTAAIGVVLLATGTATAQNLPGPAPDEAHATPQGDTGSAGEKGSTIRIALLVGNNKGDARRKPLKYAEQDVARVKRALIEVAGFPEENVISLQGASPEDLDGAMEAIDAATADSVEMAGARVILLFFYSGHSDGLNLEMGTENVPFDFVKSWLKKSDASVRIAVLDSCHSGGFSEIKGGRPGPAFDIFVDGSLDTKGMAVITSSTSGEKSQESDQISGSYFTHYLVSGLYGAADADRDRRVTLQEVYKYSYRNTLGRTLSTVVGPQHPTYEYALEGKGDLVLSMVAGGTGTIVLPKASAGDFFLFEKQSGALLAELTKAAGEERHLMVAAGTYLVTRRSGERLGGCEVTVGVAENVAVRESDIAAHAVEMAWPRGGVGEPTTAVATFYSLSGWLMREMGPVHCAGFGVTRRLGPITTVVGFSYGQSTVNDNGLIYSFDVVGLEVAPMWRFEMPAADLLLGIVGGSRVMFQDAGIGGSYSAVAGTAGLIAGADVTITEPVSVLATWELDADVFDLNGDATVELSPRAKLSVEYWF